jgi:hypothetical protein
MDDVRAPQSPIDRTAGPPISWGVREVPGRSARLPPGQGDVDVPAVVEHPLTGAERMRALLTRRALVP